MSDGFLAACAFALLMFGAGIVVGSGRDVSHEEIQRALILCASNDGVKGIDATGRITCVNGATFDRSVTP